VRSLLSNRTWLWTLLVASLAFNVGFGTTYGVRAYQRRCCGAGPTSGECALWQERLSELGLTAEQQQGMAAARSHMLAGIDECQRQLGAERERLVGLLTAAELNRDLVGGQLDRIAAVQRQIQACVVEHWLEERSLLSAEQRARFDDLIRERMCPLSGCGAERGAGACSSQRACEHAEHAKAESSEKP
jgi:Spy/CpxP family protein refolding chaperone